MAKNMRRKKPGPPARYGRRPTLTVRLQMPLYRLVKRAAAEHGKSISEEIEDRVQASLAAEATGADAEKLHAAAQATLAKANDVLDAIKRSAGGFQPWAAGELEATLETTAAARAVAGITEADVAAENARKLREADEKPPMDVKASLDRLDRIAAEAGIEPAKPDVPGEDAA
jgi:hypothetical protein